MNKPPGRGDRPAGHIFPCILPRGLLKSAHQTENGDHPACLKKPWTRIWTPLRRRSLRSERGCNFRAQRADIASKHSPRTFQTHEINAHLVNLQTLIACRLKCCRNHPCTNCKKRGEAASCTYVGRGPRGKAQHGRSSPTLVQDRLHHLENLVMSLAQTSSGSVILNDRLSTVEECQEALPLCSLAYYSRVARLGTSCPYHQVQRLHLQNFLDFHPDILSRH